MSVSPFSPGAVLSGPDLTQNITYSGNPPGPTGSWLFQPGAALFGSFTGANSDGYASPYHIYISGDAVDTGGGQQQIIAFSVNYANSAARSGNRSAIQGAVNVIGTPTGPTGYNSVGILGFARINTPQGGSGANGYTGYQGGVFGMNAQVIAQTGATAIAGAYAMELDVSVNAGASVARKTALNIVKTLGDLNRGDFEDYAVMFADQNGTTGTWKVGLSFGAFAAQWPFGSDSTLIQATARVTPSAQTPIALYGIDFSPVNFSGAAIRLPGPANIMSGTGAPGGVVTAPVGSLYMRTDGATGSTLYVKEAGSGNTGWTAK